MTAAARSYRVQRIDGQEERPVSWTVVDGHWCPVAPIESFLAYLERLGRSPNTVRAYAYDLKTYFEFLEERNSDWTRPDVDGFAQFVDRLRRPTFNVVPLGAASARSPRTINRALSAVYSFYEFHGRVSGVPTDGLFTMARPTARQLQSFLSHTEDGRLRPRRAIAVPVATRRPQVLTEAEIDTLLGACERLRDRFLLLLLHTTGIRIGQALGLRHEDFVSRDLVLRVVPRSDNANGARAKTAHHHELPIDRNVIRTYSDYMHTEYGSVDSDYVFVNLWSEPVGAPMTYSTVIDLVRRLRVKTGIYFAPHMFRHSFATRMLDRGMSAEFVSKLLTHQSVATTSGIYSHPSVEQMRKALEGRSHG